MPTPWQRKFKRRVPTFSQLSKWVKKDAVDRAMSLRQMRELRELLKRLCKTGLLTYPENDINVTRKRVGNRIKWTQITQYEVTTEVIQKVITEESSCSWAELVTQPDRDKFGQDRMFFCSHSWEEAFCEFMLTIERHAVHNSVMPEEKYWICVYAQDQWKVDLGLGLLQSPFYQALQDATSTILLLDMHSKALTRLWCNFEVHQSLALGKEIEVWTPLGRVGSSLVSSGPIVQALTNLDIGDSDATNPADKRQILNFIASPDLEFQGIDICSKNSTKSLVSPAGEYEAKLVEDNRDKFDDFNNSIRRLVPGERRRTSWVGNTFGSVEQTALRGITLERLRWLWHKIQEWVAEEEICGDDAAGPRFCCQKCAGEPSQVVRQGSMKLTPENVCWFNVESYLLKRTKGVATAYEPKGCSVTEWLGSNINPPDFRVVHWYNQTVYEFMQALEWHAQARHLPDSTSYWFRIVSSNYHQELSMDRNASYHQVEAVLEEYAEGLVVVLWPDAKTLIPNKAVESLHSAFKCKRFIDMAMPSGVLATSRPFPERSWEVGNVPAEVAEQILSFNIMTACDADNPDATADSSHHFHDLSVLHRSNSRLLQKLQKREEKANSFNQRLHVRAAGPILREAGFNDDIDSVVRIHAACPILNYSSIFLTGSLGESPLHTAAAAGSTQVVSELLRLGAHVNAEDLDGETPLHYAVLCGQEEVVKTLLAAGADVETKSYYDESPMQVAKDNVTSFLGIELDSIREILESEKAIGVQGKGFLQHMVSRIYQLLVGMSGLGERYPRLVSLRTIGTLYFVVFGVAMHGYWFRLALRHRQHLRDRF